LTEKGDRLTVEDGSDFLVMEEPRMRCRFAVGDRFVTPHDDTNP
jgi:hypothetical protein